MKILKNSIIFSVSLFVYLFLFINNTFATHAILNHYCSSQTGRQVCTEQYLDCPNGADVTTIFPGSACYVEANSSQYDCDDWRCYGGPITGCSDPNAANFVNTAYIDDGSCVYSAPPDGPEITGGYTGTVNVPVVFSFLATDPGNAQIRYGIDYTGDQVIDAWLPSSGYVNSGTSLNYSYTWTTTGNKTIYARTQNQYGVNSISFAMRDTLIASSGIVNGACSTPPNGSSYSSTPPSPYCSSGTATALSGSGPWTWTCVGSGGGTNASCSASYAGTSKSITVTALQSIRGGVLSNDSLIDTRTCGSPCVKTYPSGSNITLQAIPSSSFWKFSGWSGGGCSGTSLCSILNITTDVSITASFSPRLFNYNEL